jgi:hypothetical protein
MSVYGILNEALKILLAAGLARVIGKGFRHNGTAMVIIAFYGVELTKVGTLRKVQDEKPVDAVD